jgi:hypothetical protein
VLAGEHREIDETAGGTTVPPDRDHVLVNSSISLHGAMDVYELTTMDGGRFMTDDYGTR